MIYDDKTQPPVRRSLELLDGADHVAVEAKCFLDASVGYTDLATVSVRLEGADVRAVIAELTAIADRRGF